jgi:hypothetical protein
MTIARERPVRPGLETFPPLVRRMPNDVRWVAVQPGLWVGNARGEFAGLIETRDGGAYLASDAFAHDLGAFATLAGAKLAVGQSFDARPSAAASNSA